MPETILLLNTYGFILDDVASGKTTKLERLPEISDELYQYRKYRVGGNK